MKKILFICSPGLGIYDNAIPFLDKISNKFEVSIIFPKKKVVNQILEKELFKIYFEKIFNKAILLEGNKVSIFKPEILTKFFADKIILKFLSKFYKLLKIRSIINRIDLIVETIQFKFNLLKYSSYYKKKKIDFLDQYDLIIYDASENNQFYMKKLNEKIKDKKKILLWHGSNFPLQSKFKLDYEIKKNQIKNIEIILFSKNSLEIDFWKNKFNLKNFNFHLIGNSKQDPKWVERINLFHQSKLNRFDFPYVFLISRHPDNTYFPEYRKINLIKMIKKVIIDDLKLKLVIKLHPKESKSQIKIYEDILGKNTINDKWFISSLDPYILGYNSYFCLSFYSGLVIDLLSQNIPTIELINLKELNLNKIEDQIYFKEKTPVFLTRYLDLVLFAENHNEFYNQSNNLIQNKKKILDDLKKNFSKNCIDPKNSIERAKTLIEQII